MYLCTPMEILDPILQHYLDSHCEPEPQQLQAINRNTHVNVLRPHMLSGHYQGRLLSFFSKILAPKCILEIGTFTGYSALCLAEGLQPDGLLHTIEVNPEMEEQLTQTFNQSAWAKQIVLHIGDATQVIKQLNTLTYDLVFIDADKKNNLTYFNLIIDQVKPGGLIIIDNVLWKGKVYSDANDADTRMIRGFNDQLTADQRVDNLILPVRDGIFIGRKK